MQILLSKLGANSINRLLHALFQYFHNFIAVLSFNLSRHQKAPVCLPRSEGSITPNNANPGCHPRCHAAWCLTVMTSYVGCCTKEALSLLLLSTKKIVEIFLKVLCYVFFLIKKQKQLVMKCTEHN